MRFSKLVSGLFQHVLQVWMPLFRMCQKLPSIATQGLVAAATPAYEGDGLRGMEL